jgi:uncharacterized membrane protein (Fun14 family)
MNQSERKDPAERPKIPTWKKLLLALSGVFVIVGLGLAFVGSRQDEGGNARVQSTPGSLLTGESAPSGDASAGTSSDDGVTSLSPFFVKGGLSFFVGFCLGYALRSFFKVSAIVVGVIALAIFGLSYAGALDVDWTTIDAGFDRIVASIKEQASGFKTFITGSLPSAGLATLGIVTGFKR